MSHRAVVSWFGPVCRAGMVGRGMDCRSVMERSGPGGRNEQVRSGWVCRAGVDWLGQSCW